MNNNKYERIKHLKTLGILNPDVSNEKIKKAWRELCKKHHPDKGGDKDEFLKINHAYNMIINPQYQQQEKEKNDNPFDIDIRINLPISFEEGFFGKKFSLSISMLAVGSNHRHEMKFNEDGTVMIEMLDIEVEPGTCSPSELILPNKGYFLKDSDKRGSVCIILAPHKHHLFSVVEKDVVSKEEVPLDIMLCGGNFECRTMYGLKTVTVPPGSAPGTVIAIPDCGVSKKGKHLVSIYPKFPSKDELTKNKNWKKMNIKFDEDQNKAKKESENDKAFEERFFKFVFNTRGNTFSTTDDSGM